MQHIVIITKTVRSLETDRLVRSIQRLSANSAKDAKRLAEALNTAFDFDRDDNQQRCAEPGYSIHLTRGAVHLNLSEMETIASVFMDHSLA